MLRPERPNRLMFTHFHSLCLFSLTIAISADTVHSQTAPFEGGLDMTIELHDALEPDRGEELPADPPSQDDKQLRNSDKWRQMERIEAQGGERADLSRRTSKDVRMSPVVGGRRQAGNPERFGDDAKPRLPFGLEFMREF